MDGFQEREGGRDVAGFAVGQFGALGFVVGLDRRIVFGERDFEADVGVG